MPNVFLNLPMPVLNGPGTAVDVSAMGAIKTLAVKGTFPGASITIEISATAGGAGAYAPIHTFIDGDTPFVLGVACLYMRTNVKNRLAGGVFAVDADVAANGQGALAAVIPVPAANGLGAPVDVSALGTFQTYVVSGGLAGAAVAILGSLDGTAYVPIHVFTGAGGQFTQQGVWKWLRTNVSGYTTAMTATARVAACNDAAPPAPPGPPIPGVPGDSGCLVFKPGSANVGPVVWNDWAALYAYMDAMRTAADGGCYTIAFDDSITSPAVVPVGAGPWDMTGVAWKGAGNGAAVSLADGVTFLKLRSFFNLVVTSLATGAALRPIDDVEDGAQFFVRRTTLQAVSNATPQFIRFSNAGTFTVWLMEGSALGGAQTGPVLGTLNATAKHVQLILDASSRIAVLTALGVDSSGGFADLSIEAPDMIRVPVSTWNVASASPVLEGPACLRPNPYLGAPSSAAVTLLHGQWARLGALIGVGAVTQPLPSINAAAQGLKAAGTYIQVSNDSTATAPVTVSAAGGDTIDGGSVTLAAGASVLLVSDGVSKWTVVSNTSVVAPSPVRYAAPRTWYQSDVANNQSSVVLQCGGMGVDVLGNTIPKGTVWRAFRAGSVVGISTELSEAITSGLLYVYPTINGVSAGPGLDAAGGALGNQATYAGGTYPYAAGDLIGMKISTGNGYAPTTLDIEAWLQVQDN